MFSPQDIQTLKHWLVIFVTAFLVGAGDYVFSNVTGATVDWKESGVKALAAGLLVAWPVIRKALLSDPPSA